MGKGTTWRPKGQQWKQKKNSSNNNQQQDCLPSLGRGDGLETDEHKQTTASSSVGGSTEKKSAPFPKHCRGLVHLALNVAYTGIPFRGLQLQTNEHISHTVEGQLLLGLKNAGYLADDDFTDNGTKLKTEGGIRIVTVRADDPMVDEEESREEKGEKATSDQGVVGVDTTTNELSTEPTAAAIDGGYPQDPEKNATTNTDDNVNNDNTGTQSSSTHHHAPHVHKTVVPPHLQMSKRQRKKFDPNFNPDGRFNFARACRTDKGVHAVRNIVSLYLREEDWLRDGNEGMMMKINASLPICDDYSDEEDYDKGEGIGEDNKINEGVTRESIGEQARRDRKRLRRAAAMANGTDRQKNKMVIQVLSVTPVLPSFNPKDCCNSRTYRYLIPLYALGLPATHQSSRGGNNNNDQGKNNSDGGDDDNIPLNADNTHLIVGTSNNHRNPMSVTVDDVLKTLDGLSSTEAAVTAVTTSSPTSGAADLEKKQNEKKIKAKRWTKEEVHEVVESILSTRFAQSTKMAASSSSGVSSSNRAVVSSGSDNSTTDPSSANYFNGSVIDDWETLFRFYPELLDKGRDCAATVASSSDSDMACTWLPKPSELLRGKSAHVAAAVEEGEEERAKKKGRRANANEQQDENEPEELTDGDNTTTTSADGLKREEYDHPILRQIIEYCNHFLHNTYVGASKRFHNFSATALDGEASGHRNSSAAKQLKGDDNEASRSIRRCEISPCVVWVKAPFMTKTTTMVADSNDSNKEGSSHSTPAATTDGEEREKAEREKVVKKDLPFGAEWGTTDFLIGGDYGDRDIRTYEYDEPHKPSQQQQQQEKEGGAEEDVMGPQKVRKSDPAASLYMRRNEAFEQRGIAQMAGTTLPTGDQTHSHRHSHSSSPPLLPFVVFQVEGQSFLLNMIRKLVGFMLAVVRGGRPWWVPELLTYNTMKALEERYQKAEVEEVESAKDDEEMVAVATTLTNALTTTMTIVCHKDANVTFPQPYVPPTLPPVSSSLSFSFSSSRADQAQMIADSYTKRCAFNGVCKPSVLTEAFDPTLFVQVPLAPGPYLSLMHSRYTAYDMGVRTMARRSQKRAAWEAKMKMKMMVAEEQAEAKANLVISNEEGDTAKTETECGKDGAAVCSTEANTCATSSDHNKNSDNNVFFPYYHTHVFPISDSWGNKRHRTMLPTTTLISSVTGKTAEPSPFNVLARLSSSDRRGAGAGAGAGSSTRSILLGEKRPRETSLCGDGESLHNLKNNNNNNNNADENINTNNNNTPLSLPIPPPPVEPLAESFYWNVIARDIVAWDSNIYLNDIDVSLAIRDGKRAARQKEEMKRANEREEKKNKNIEEGGNAIVKNKGENVCVVPREPKPLPQQHQDSSSTETPLELFDRFTTPSSSATTVTKDGTSTRTSYYAYMPLAASDAANDRFLNRLRLQATAPTRCGEMTLFLRSLRVYNWHVKTDQKVADRLNAQHQQSVKNWEERQARRLVVAQQELEENATAVADEENKPNENPTTTVATTATSSCFIPKSVLRKQWHHERLYLDEVAVQRMLSEWRKEEDQRNVRGRGAHDNSNEKMNKEQRGAQEEDNEGEQKKRRRVELTSPLSSALLSSSSSDSNSDNDDGGDEASTPIENNNTCDGSIVCGNGNGRNEQPRTNHTNNNNNNSTIKGEDDLSNYSTFELRDDDGWWYSGHDHSHRTLHRYVYKKAMVAIVEDRNKSICRMP